MKKTYRDGKIAMFSKILAHLIMYYDIDFCEYEDDILKFLYFCNEE